MQNSSDAPGQRKAIGSYGSHQDDFSALIAVIPDGKVGQQDMMLLLPQQRLICVCFQSLPKQPIRCFSTLTQAVRKSQRPLQREVSPKVKAN